MMKKIIMALVLMMYCCCYAATSAKLENINVSKAIDVLSKKAIETNTTIFDKSDNYIKMSFATSLLDTAIYGSNFNTTPQNTCSVTMVQDNKNVLAQISCEMVTNPNSAFQKNTNIQKEELLFKRGLEKMFNPHFEYGFKYKTWKDYAKITEIDESIIKYEDNSEKLDIGDRIVLINDVPINMPLISRLNYDPIPELEKNLETLKLTIRSKGLPEKIITLKRVYIKPKF